MSSAIAFPQEQLHTNTGGTGLRNWSSWSISHSHSHTHSSPAGQAVNQCPVERDYISYLVATGRLLLGSYFWELEHEGGGRRIKQRQLELQRTEDGIQEEKELKIKRKQTLQRPRSSSLIPNTSVTVQTTKNTDKEKEILKAKPHCSLSSNRPRSHIQPTDPKHQLIPLHTFTEKTLYRNYTLCTALGPNSCVSATRFATHIPLVSSFHAKCNYNWCHI